MTGLPAFPIGIAQQGRKRNGGDEPPAAASSQSHPLWRRPQAEAHDFGAFFGDQRRRLSVLV
jgi:hypothetical protein